MKFIIIIVLKPAKKIFISEAIFISYIYVGLFIVITCISYLCIHALI